MTFFSVLSYFGKTHGAFKRKEASHRREMVILRLSSVRGFCFSSGEHCGAKNFEHGLGDLAVFFTSHSPL